MIKVIFAVGDRGEFGYKGQLPWDHCKVDMLHFMKYTKGCTVVMGRKTYESLPLSGLPNREIVVMTNNRDKVRDRNLPCISTEFLSGGGRSFPDFLVEWQENGLGGDLIVIGGPSLILDALKVADEVSLSFIHKDTPEPFDHDTFMDMGILNYSLFSRFSRDSRNTPERFEDQPLVTFETWRVRE